jgi:tetratricopeptide (TPR) repeat protein
MWSGFVRAALTAAALAAASPTVPFARQARSPSRDTALVDATTALQAGAFDRAVALATAYFKQHPTDAAAQVLLARVGIARNDLDTAYLALQRALEIDPRNVDALYYLGMVSGRLAQTSFEELQRTAPDSARVHQLIAEGLEAQDRRDAAAAEYEAALARQPGLLDALLALARLRRIRLACDTAVPLYQKAEAIHPTFDGAYGLGVCQSLLQDDESAKASFERAIARDPRSAIAWMSLGESLSKLGRPAEAIVKLQRAILLEPRLGEAYYALGSAYRATGQPALSQQAFKKAEALGAAVGVAPDPPQDGPSPPR